MANLTPKEWKLNRLKFCGVGILPARSTQRSDRTGDLIHNPKYLAYLQTKDAPFVLPPFEASQIDDFAIASSTRGGVDTNHPTIHPD